MSLDEEIVLGCAFRYALGRMTYVVGSVASEIERRAHELPIAQCARLIREINEAIDNNSAGMQMDVDRWRRCREVLQKRLNDDPLYSGIK